MSTNVAKIAVFVSVALMLLVSVVFASLPPTVTVSTPVSEGMSTPIRITLDTVGNFYLSDPRGGGIIKLSNTGKLLKIFSTAKPPQGIAIHADGNLIVSQGDFAAVLDKNSGAEIRRLGSGSGQFKRANGITVDSAGYIYVVDSLDNCVQVFTSNGAPVSIPFSAPGKPVNSFGSFGNEYGQFIIPTGIAYEKISNQLAVVDTKNGRVQFFTTQGDFRKSIGTFGSGPLNFTAPQAVAFEYSKVGALALTRMYIVDSFQSLVQTIDPAGKGTFLSYIGSYGTSDGKLTNPSDAVFDQFDPQSSRLVVVNGRGNLTFYGIDKGMISPTTPVGPALTVNPIPTITNLTTLVISGTVAAGATVKVNNIPANVSGTAWNVTVTPATGANGISIVATDAAGNTTTKTYIVTVDSTSTQLTINPVNSPTRLAVQTITGTVDTGANVKVNGTTATVTGNSWSYNATLAEGVNSFAISAGISGKKESTTTISITRQSIAPVITLSMLSNGSTAAGQIQNVTGIIYSANLGSVTVNGQPVTVTNSSFNTLVNLVHGANIITVLAIDAAGNSTTVTRTVNFDATSPVVMNIASPDGIITNINTTTLSGTADKTSAVVVNGYPVVVDENGIWTTTVNLAAGLNTFEVRIKDQTDKTTSTKRTIIFDPVGAELSITSITQDLATNNPNLVITGSAPTSGVTVTGAVNGVNSPVTLSNGTFTFSAAFPAEGLYTVAVTAVDSAENIRTVIRNVVFDVTPPQFTVDPVTTNSPTKFTGTIEKGATLTVRDKNVSVGTVTIDSDGKWSVDLTGVNYDPATLSITPTDAAGNSALSGDLDGNGKVDLADAVKTIRFAVNLAIPTFNDLMRGDVAPLRNHVSIPDGVIDIDDVILIMRKVVGLPW